MHAMEICRPRTATEFRLLEQMYRLRAKVFGKRLGWVECPDDYELDEFDALDPTYILALDEDKVLGCARLLPSCRPTMLHTMFSNLLGDEVFSVHPAMIESSRFCVDTTQTSRSGEKLLHVATQTMFAAIVEWCLINGYTEIETVTDVRLERLLHRSGWTLRRLGTPRTINDTLAVAGLLPVDVEIFERLRPVGFRSEFSRNNPNPREGHAIAPPCPEPFAEHQRQQSAPP